MNGASPPYRAMALLAVVGLLERAAFLSAADVWLPFGEDAEFWGYRAVEMLHGQVTGSHPPVYPFLSVLVAAIPGVDVPTATMLVAVACGVAMAPAMAAGVAAVAGTRAGVFAGVLTLLLPNLLAWSVRVEPSSLFVTLLGIGLLLVGRVVHRGSLSAALALGAVIALLGLTKENGHYYLVPLGLPAVLARPGRRIHMLLALAVGFAVPWGGYAWLEVLYPTVRQLGHKAQLPFDDMLALLREGTIPPPLKSGDEPGLRLGPEVAATLQAEGVGVADRLRWTLALQLQRTLRFLGPWLLLVPAATAGVVLLWRSGRLERWQVGLLLLAQSMLALLVVVFVQARHAEVAVLGTIWAASVGGAVLWERGRRGRVAILGTLAVLAIYQVWVVTTVEVPRAREIGTYARAMRASGAWVVSMVPEGAAVASPEQWVGFFVEQQAVALFQAPPTDRPVYVVFNDSLELREGGVPRNIAPLAPVAALYTERLGRMVLLLGLAPRHIRSATVRLDHLQGETVVPAGSAPLETPTYPGLDGDVLHRDAVTGELRKPHPSEVKTGPVHPQ